MSEKFLQIKRKAQGRLLLLAAVLGVAAGLCGFAIPLLVQKLVWNRAELLFPFLIGAACLLLSAGLILLLGWQTDRRVARRIDARYLQRERAQTMLAFRQKESEMLRLQREDTEQKLAALPRERIGISTLALLILAVLISAALFCAALFVPITRNEPDVPPDEPVETPFAFSEWQKARLLDLIRYVEGSQLESGAKSVTVAELNNLYNALLTVTTREQMVTLVTGSMVVIDNKIEEVNTFEEIIGVLALADDADIIGLARAIGRVTEIPNAESLRVFKESCVDAKTGYFSTLAAKIELDLVKLSSYKENPVYLAISAMAADMRSLEVSLAEVKQDEARRLLIEATLDAVMVRTSVAAADQTNNRNVGDTVISELMFIFDLGESELPASILDNGIAYGNSSGNYEEKEDESLSGGGAGRDEMNYGSDDEIYDPDLALRVKYGEVYKKYSAIMREKEIAGELPPEYQKYITDYFSALYSGDTTT